MDNILVCREECAKSHMTADRESCKRNWEAEQNKDKYKIGLKKSDMSKIDWNLTKY